LYYPFIFCRSHIVINQSAWSPSHSTFILAGGTSPTHIPTPSPTIESFIPKGKAQSHPVRTNVAFDLPIQTHEIPTLLIAQAA
jgi:hypothetical protein